MCDLGINNLLILKESCHVPVPVYHKNWNTFSDLLNMCIHHIYINCWFPLYRWSVMEKQVTSTPPPPPIPGNGGGGVLVTCIYITDHL